MTIEDTLDGAGRKSSSLQDAFLTTYDNDSIGRLLRQQATGAWATFAYDGVGNVLVKQSHGSNPITTTYDVANRIVTAIQGVVVTTSSYDNAGNPFLENRLGALTSYVYDGENRMVKQTNPDGKVTTNTYSGSGLKRSYQEFGGTVHTLVWDGSDYLGEVTA